MSVSAYADVCVCVSVGVRPLPSMFLPVALFSVSVSGLGQSRCFIRKLCRAVLCTVVPIVPTRTFHLVSAVNTVVVVVVHAVFGGMLVAVVER